MKPPMDWDDIRFFLAVSRGGSVRAAAERLGVNHSTVLRRIGRLERRLGAAIFSKLPSGYRLTEAGEEVVAFADAMELSSDRLQSRVFGRDQGVAGLLRVTTAATLASHLLMPDFAAFTRLHPDVELEILSADDPVNLTNREADLAIRVVFDRDKLPPNLHGLPGPDLFGTVFLSRDLLGRWRAQPTTAMRRIVRSGYDPDWTRQGVIPTGPVPFRTTDPAAQLAALHEGVGLTALPCFVGDTDPLLARVPGAPLHRHGALWLLTQGETRRTRRVRLLADFLASRLAVHASLLAGSLPAPDPAGASTHNG